MSIVIGDLPSSPKTARELVFYAYLEYVYKIGDEPTPSDLITIFQSGQPNSEIPKFQTHSKQSV